MEGVSKHQYTNRIPVTIITGFLGSGKTTFVNQILLKHPQTRFAIIENEFGKLGIDKDILIKHNTPIYELLNGCICCSLNEDFYKALEMILEKHKDIDHLLIETTGIADPTQVIDLFVANDHIQQHFLINSVICLADTSVIEAIINKEPESLKQIVLADIVVLNKIDLFENQKLERLAEMISEINPMAEIIKTSHAQTNGSPILNTKAYSSHHIENSTLSFDNIRISMNEMVVSQAREALNGAAFKHRIHAEGFIFNECFDPELFNIWMSSYIYFNQNSLYRVKGILYCRNKKKKYIFQAVKGSCVFEEGSEWREDEDKFSKIVFIGKYLDRSDLESKLKKLFLHPHHKGACPV